MTKSRIYKYIFGVLFTVLLLLACPLCTLTALADGEDDYFTREGRIDPFTGELVTEDENSDASGSIYSDGDRRYVADGEYYDFSSEYYIFPLSDGTEISATVADGMIVNETVILNVPEGVAATLYRNGSELELDSELSKSGEYTLQVADGGTDKRLLSFTIVDKTTGLITGYTMPSGFRVREAYKDGEDAEWYSTYVSMEEEGFYSVYYMCERTEVPYELAINIDHTPPGITLKGVDAKGKARGPVTIEGLEEGDRISVIKDGEVYNPSEPKLTQYGRYKLTVIDSAGNEGTYEFTILIYIDTSGVFFFIILGLVIVGVVTFLILQRKHLRIR